MNTKKGSNKTRNIILTIFGILIFSVIGTLAVIRDSNDVSQYMVRDNITLNNSGMYYGGEKAFTKTADVVVCRSTSALDHAKKWFTCDVVCAWSDTDCTHEIRNCNGKHCFIKRPENNNCYPINTYDLPDEYGFNNSLLINQSNTLIDSDFACINYSSLVSRTYSVGINIVDTSEVEIKNLILISNRACSAGCRGIGIQNSKNIYLEKVTVKDFNGFQIKIDARNGNTSHIYLSYINASGVGSSDVIGGGVVNESDYLEHIIIEKSNVLQRIDLGLGTYSNAIDIVGANNLIIKDNDVIGNILFGSETKATSNSIMENNYIIPAIGSSNSNIRSPREDSYNNYFIKNILIDGYLSIFGNYNYIELNTITGSQSSIINGSYNEISKNSWTNGNTGSIPLSIYGDYNSINENNFIKGRKCINIGSGINNNVFKNKIFNVTGAANALPIISDSSATYTIIDSNEIYHFESPIALPAVIGLYNHDIIVKDNKLFNYGNSANITSFIRLYNANTVNSTIENNQILTGNAASYIQFTSTSDKYQYINPYIYTLPINKSNYDPSNYIFNKKQIWNSSASCIAINTTDWKCWTMA